MVAETSPTASAPSVEAGGAARMAAAVTCRYKYRLRFRKDGDLRLVSHHDLMHVFERMLRRAQLPIAHTQGFHPQPRMVFALSLALGIAGANEVLELDLTLPVGPEDLLARLACQAPPGLEIRSVRCLQGKSSSLVRRAFYRLPLQLEPEKNLAGPSGMLGTAPLDLVQRCRALLEQAHLWVERSRPQSRRLDIRPYLNKLEVESGNLEMAVRVTPTGTARPDEVARLLGLDFLLEAGAYFQRTDLEMMDEVSAPAPEVIAHIEEIAGEQAVPAQAAAAVPAGKPARGPTALVSGPLSFDS